MSDGVLESTLASVEAAAGRALAAAAVVTRDLKKVRAGAAAGQLRDLRRALDATATSVRDLTSATESLRGAYDVDEAVHLGEGGYLKELADAVREAELAVLEEEDRLLVYPSIVRLVAADAAVEVDKVRVRALRPSVLVERLRAAQTRPPRFRPEPFLASLSTAYDLMLARDGKPAGAVVRLLDVHKVLTPLPGQSREYSRQEFARDLYLLDQSGVTSAGDRRLRFAASTGSKGAGVLTTVARTGQPQRYWGVSFA